MCRKLVVFVLAFGLIAGMARAEFVITNGDFEAGAGAGDAENVSLWYDDLSTNFWESAWELDRAGVTPNGSMVVVFCSWNTVEGDPLTGSYVYQSIGTSSGESSVTIGFDWGHPDDAAAGRLDGITIAVYASDGTTVPGDDVDINGAAGITLLDSASYSHVAEGTDGEIFPVVVTLDLSGANAGDEIFLRFNNYLPEAGADPWPILDNVQIISEAAPEPVVPFSLGAVEDIELGNDPQTGPDSSSNGSGLGARDVADRRRVFLVSYDISALKSRGPVSNVSLSNFSHDQHGEVNVYGVIEDLDLLEVESLTWNTAPGVQNNPTPELNSPVALDPNDLTDVLLTFTGPGETGVRFSTDTSQALADFINSDTDGIITLLVAPSAEGNQLIVRARTHSAGGTFLEGDIAPVAKIIWVSDNLKYDFAAGLPSDHGFVELLRAQGYLVDYKGEFDPHVEGNDEIPVNPEWTYWRELDEDKIAELEAADLIIIGRVNNSGSFDDTNEAEMWNAISTPMISQSAHISRQYSKWGWFATGSTTNKTPRLMQVTAPDHDIFAGVAIDPNGNVDMVVQDAQVTLVKLNEGIVEGNGTLLGVHDEGYPWIVEWPAGVEYYEGSGQIAGGPRMFLGSAVGATNEAAGLIEGGYNLTADGEKVFLNAVKYMLPAKPVGPSTEGLVAYYALDGNADDSSGNGLNGIEAIMGAGNAATYVAGAAGMAIDLLPANNGTVGPYVDCGADPLFDLVDAVTVGAWVNFRTVPDEWRAIVAKGDSAWRIGNVGATTALHFGFCGYASRPTTHGIDGTTQVGFDSWHYVCGTYDITEGAKLYVDGVLDAEVADTAGIALNTYNVTIGANLQDTGWKPYRLFDGMIDEVRIYNRALSADEILDLMGQ